MKKNLPLYFVLGFLVLISLSTIVGFAVNKTTLDKNKSSSSSSFDVTTYKTPGDILKSGVSLECKVVEQNKEIPVYIKNSAVFGKRDTGNFLLKDNTLYTWEDGKNDGYLFKISPEMLFQSDQELSNGNPKLQDSVKGRISTNFAAFRDTCKPAEILDNKFAIPVSINFTDLSQIMQQSSRGLSMPSFNYMSESSL